MADVPWLLIILRNRLTLSWLFEDIGPGFRLGTDLFEEVSEGWVTGFYDRLYHPNGHFVGLQIAPVRVPPVTPQSSGLPYARTGDDVRNLQLFFTSSVPLEVTVKWDQAFGGRIYRSFDGEFALTLEMGFLKEHERGFIASADAAWVSIESFSDW